MQSSSIASRPITDFNIIIIVGITVFIVRIVVKVYVVVADDGANEQHPDVQRQPQRKDGKDGRQCVDVQTE